LSRSYYNDGGGDDVDVVVVVFEKEEEEEHNTKLQQLVEVLYCTVQYSTVLFFSCTSVVPHPPAAVVCAP
jgi:hypothetical protein